MAFVQIIEFTTTRPDEVEALVSEWRTKTAGRRTAQRGTFTQDRERPNTYVQIVEFPSCEDAIANSDLPETALSPSASASCATGRCCSATWTCEASKRCDHHNYPEKGDPMGRKVADCRDFPTRAAALSPFRVRRTK